MATAMFGWLRTILYPPNAHVQSQELANTSSQPHPPSLRFTPTLLSLPPELRLMIFEFVLITGEIKVKVHTSPPALLATNRQIRNETHRIWYTQNHFHFRIIDCDASIAYKFYQRTAYRRLRPPKPNFTFSLKGKRNWDNLLSWCRNVYEGTTISIDSLPLAQIDTVWPARTVTVATAHEISVASKRKGESWEECKRTLESLRKMAVVTDNRWLG